MANWWWTKFRTRTTGTATRRCRPPGRSSSNITAIPSSSRTSMSKSFGRSARRLSLLTAACAALLLAHGASSVVSVQSGDVRLVGKTRYLNNAHSAVTHTVDDSTKHVVAVIDELDKYGVKGTLFISTEQDPPVEERFFTQ